MNYQEIRRALENEFSDLDIRDEVVYGPHVSIHRETREMILFGIIARKTGGRYFYPPEIAERDRLLLVKLVRQIDGNAFSIEYPYRDPDLEKMWECMFDVWVKSTKKAKYAEKFMKLINAKLRQAKLELSEVAN